ncbi:MAG: hypothetical protein LBS99_02405 [Clostridiales bacterium]|jgi:septum formation topological specificity factor MinE|nr:hypothetical protein [Clostridiales bacterium]
MTKRTVRDLSVARLKNVLSADKTVSVPQRLAGLVKSDLFELLGNYFVLDDITVDLSHDKDKYVMQISVFADKIKGINGERKE